MAVSPRETMVGMREYRWRGLVCASLLLTAVVCGAAANPEPRFFRIGTAATGGSFFEIGGVVAGAISGPAAGPACGYGGSCGGPGLVAGGQGAPRSLENFRLINNAPIESRLAPADLARWASWGTPGFAESGPPRQA